MGGSIAVTGDTPTPAPTSVAQDTTAPSIVTYNPSQGSSAQSKSVTITLTFSESVQAGTGNIVLTPSGGNGANTAVSIDVATAAVTFSGVTMTVDPISNLVDTGGKTYQITMASGVVKDASANNNAFAGLTGTTYQFGVADSTVPSVTAYSPTHLATNVAKGTDIVLTFTENIQAGTGNIVLTPSGGNGPNTVVNIGVSSGQVTFSGTTATINPTDDLVDDGGKTFTVTMASGVLKDMQNNAYAGLSGTTYQFTVPDATPPVITAYSPGLNAINVVKTANIVLTFSENVQQVTGHNIQITPDTGSNITIAADDAAVTVSGKHVTINPATDFVAVGMRYTVTVPSGSFTDSVNTFAGISGTAYRFTVADTTAPTLVSTNPAHNATSRHKSTDVVLTFNEPMSAGSGNIILTPSGGTGSNTAVTVDVSSSEVTFNGAVVTINPEVDLPDHGGKAYTVTFAPGVLQDLAGNSPSALTSPNYQFGITDSTPPLILIQYLDFGNIWQVAPGRGATDQSKSTDVAITFTEGVQAGTGNILLTPSGGNGENTVTAIDVASAQVVFSGSRMTINPDTDLLDTGGKDYAITMGSGVVKDAAGFEFAGLSGTDYTFSVVDTSAPVILTFSPAQGAIDQAKSTNIMFTLNENMMVGTGNIVLTPSGGNGDNTAVSINVQGGYVVVSQRTVTINPFGTDANTHLVDTGGKTYTVTMASGVLKDAQSIAHAGLSSPTFQFTLADSTPPSLVANGASPANGASVNKTANLELTFSEYVQAATGVVVLTPSGGNGANTARSFDVAGAEVTVSNNVVTVNPSVDLADNGGKVYTATIASAVIKDIVGNAWQGLAGTGLVFSVSDSTPPTVTSFSPPHNAIHQAKNTNIVLVFPETVKAGSGNVRITSSGGSGADAVVDIGITSSDVTFAVGASGTTVTINPPNDLPDAGGKTQDVTIAAGVILDAVNNSFAGLSQGVYRFSLEDSSAVDIAASGFSPLQGATGKSKSVNISLTFLENIQSGTGNIVITSSGGNGPDETKTISVADAQVTINSNRMLINPTADFFDTGGKIQTVTMSSTVIKDLSNNPFPGFSGTNYQFTVADSTPPTVTEQSPTNSAVDLLKSINVQLVFSEFVKAGTGNIVLTPSGGTGTNTAVLIPIASGQVTFSNKVVTINPTNDLLDTGGKTYTVTMESGVITDMQNNAYAGLSGTSYQFNVVDSTQADIIAYSPAQGAQAQAKSVSITLTFNENVQGGTGHVVLTPSGGNGGHSAVVIAVAGVAFSGTTATIDPASDLDDRGGKRYTITTASGVFKDGSSNAFPGISGTTYQFDVADSTPPSVVTFSPAQAATGQVNSVNIVLTFSEHVKAGAGNIVITPSGGQGANDAVNVDVTSGAVTFSGTTMTIDPTNALADMGGKLHTITMASGTVTDIVGNAFAAITGTTYRFTVADSTAPLITSFSPTHQATAEAKDITITLTFNENIKAGTGNIVITPSGGNGANTPVSISVGSAAEIQFVSNIMLINPDADLVDTGAKRHTITISSGVILDTQDVAFSGLSGSAYYFAVADSTPPTLASSNPVHLATDIAKTSAIVLTFSENVQAGTGNFVVNPSEGNGPNDLVNIPIVDSQITFVGPVVTVRPAVPMVDTGGKIVLITMESTVIKDSQNNAFAGLTALDYRFIVADSTAPQVATFLPAQGAHNQANSVNIVLTFTEFVQAGTGNIVLTPSEGNQANTAVSIAVGSAAVTFADTVMTINPSSNLVDTGGKIYTITMASGVVTDASANNNAFAGLTGTTYQFGVADSTVPSVTAYSPTHLATNVAKGTDIVLTFTENIQAGTGNIVLTPSGGNGPNTVVNIGVSSGQVTFSGTTATINPTDDLIDTGGKTITVTMASGVLKDMQNNAYAGLSGTTYQFTVLDSTPPVITAYSPGLNAINVVKTANIVLTFSENVQQVTGHNIQITPDTGSAITIAADDAAVTVSGKHVTINPATDFVAVGMRYTVTVPSGSFTDSINTFAGISANTYRFTVADTTAPTLLASSPAHNAASLAKNTDIVLTFNEPMQAGSGNIVLTPSGGNGANTAVTVAVSSSEITFNGALVTINPSANLIDDGGKTYTITMASGVLNDISSNAFAGLAGTTYQFQVADSSPPVVSVLFPVHNAVQLLKTTNIVLTFNENVQASSGNVVLVSSGGSGDDKVYSIDVAGAEVIFSGTNMTIDPSTDLLDEGGKTYAVTIAQGVIADASFNNHFAGLVGMAYTFTLTDSTMPTVVAYSPSQGASGLLKSVDIRLTFSENVQAGMGTISLVPSGGNGPNVPVQVSVTSGHVSFSNNAMTINPSADLVDAGGKTYTINLLQGVVVDTVGNPHSGLNASYSFTLVDTTAPIILQYSPTNAATNQSKNVTVVITFSEHVTSGTGNIILTPTGGNGANVPVSIDVSSGQVTFNGSQMIINPSSDLVDAGNKLYTVTFASGVVKDVSSNLFAGILGTTYQFEVRDSTAPTVTSYYPLQNAIEQPKNRSIVLTFSENMQAGSGIVMLTPSEGNGPNPVTEVDITSPEITISSTQVTINPSSDFVDTGDKLYTVTMASGVLKDVTGNPFEGLSGTTYQFQVDDSTAPTVASLLPANGAINQHKGTNITFYFSEYVKRGVGSILLTPSGGNQNNDVVSININSTTQIFINANTMIIDPAIDLIDKGGKTYTVTMASGVIFGLGNNPFIFGLGNNPYVGLTGTQYQFTVQDLTPPSVVGYHPAHGAVNQSKATDVQLTFDEDVQAGVGDVILTPAGGSSAHPQVVISVLSSQIVFSGSKMTLNPTSFLGDNGTTYTVTMLSGVVKDARGNAYNGLFDQTFQFTVAQTLRPSMPAGLTATVTSQNTINLTWVPPFNGNSPLISYKLFMWRENCGFETCDSGINGRWDQGLVLGVGALSSGIDPQPHSGTRNSVEITTVPVDQMLKFKLQAANDLGFGSFSPEKPVTMRLCSSVNYHEGSRTTWHCLV